MTKPVLSFVLPVPLTGLSLVSDLVERLYGTGEPMMTFDENRVIVGTPKEGFGPLKTSGRRPSRPKDTDALITAAKLERDRLSMTLEDAESRILLLIEAQRIWFSTNSAINYVETGVCAAGEEPEFIFTLQRAQGQTPHALREEAEARANRAEETLRRISKALVDGDITAARELAAAVPQVDAAG